MASILSQQATGKSTPISLTSIVTQLFLCITDIAGLGILIVVVGIFIVISALVGIIFLLLLVLLLSSLFLVLKACCALVLQILHLGKNSMAAAFTKVTTSNRYRTTIKLWLIAALKKLILWLIPFLLKHLWQWASSSGGSRSQYHTRMFQALPG